MTNPVQDTAEFIEIYNGTGGVINLTGYSLQLINGNGGSSYATVALGSGDIAAGDFFVVCGDQENVANCDLEGFSSVQNGSPDAVALLFNATIVDTVSYEGDTIAPYTEGSGVGLTDDGSGGIGGGNDFKSISRLPDGTDTDQNNTDLSFVCMSPGESNLSTTSACVPPAVEAIVINEIDYQETGVADNEFIELYNSGNTMINLDTYTIDLIDGSGATSYQSIDLPNVDLTPGDYYCRVCRRNRWQL